jgi:hypothetical protein
MRNGPIRHATELLRRLGNDLGFGQKQLLPASQEVGDDTAPVVCAWLRRSYATQEPRNTAERAGVEGGHQLGLWRLFWAANPQNPKTHFRRPPASQIWESVC